MFTNGLSLQYWMLLRYFNQVGFLHLTQSNIEEFRHYLILCDIVIILLGKVCGI